MAEEILPVSIKLEFLPVVLPTTQALLDKIAADIEDAKSLVIDSQVMAEIATETAGKLSTVRDAMDAERLAMTKPLRDGVGTINGGFNPAIEMLDNHIKALKTKLVEWNRLVKRQQEEAAAAARAAAKKAQEEAEAAAKAQAAEAKRLLDEAKKAQDSGDSDKAGDLVQQAQQAQDIAQQTAQQAAMPVQTAAIYTGPATVKGASVTYKARVLNKAALIQHIAARLSDGDTSLIGLLEVNEAALNQLARVQKDGMKISGVEVYEAESVRTRKVAV